MYSFVFIYFLRVIVNKRDMPEFTAKLGVCIIAGLHLGLMFTILAKLRIMAYPRFSNIYLYNKLGWYFPIAVLVLLVLAYFSKSRTARLIEKYSARDVHTFPCFLLFISTIVAPVSLIVIIGR
ncbi:MAG: hypothetical protein EOO05_07910 [Chitinophagaceae bacterium]|nr:MAG: hypothetical protein EOO05_07910 [Chitinophagaceae bacterium]